MTREEIQDEIDDVSDWCISYSGDCKDCPAAEMCHTLHSFGILPLGLIDTEADLDESQLPF